MSIKDGGPRLPKVCLRCGGKISKKWAKIITKHLVSGNQICEKCDDKLGTDFITNYKPNERLRQG